MDISVVIPIYNEAGNIVPLHDELVEVLDQLGSSYEVLFVNDGSTDASLMELQSLMRDNGHGVVRIIDLGENQGQSAAFTAGFQQATGRLVVSMDGDRQNDPHDIPAMIEMLQGRHLDVVAGWRKDRHDKKSLSFFSRIGRLVRFMLFADTTHDSGCSLRVYRREAVEHLELQPNMHRYMLLMIRNNGFSVGEMVVNDRSRVIGVSKYKVSKKIFENIHDMFRLRFSREFVSQELLQITVISLFTVAIVLTVYFGRNAL